ncbi:threonine synthase [Bifidobacterium sp. ESL0728]|uniref:threonine synthase n=1 Tax=Bifidobacterium sp. ESL0728 TaxID=2983220 RepID=UPI0023F86389|nr:threonine synthase [Bifidobacterium sp. ESL0728]WEV59966.1 threonine synthase [Bifidobacterium sp. ESL0728]
MNTTFHSTRSSSEKWTSRQAIRQGLAGDGGLFVTDDLGKQQIDVAALVGKSYQDMARTVLGVLLPDFSTSELDECVRAAYGSQWLDSAITPLKPLGDDYILELFNGPTSAFKDVALQILPQFMARTTSTIASCESSKSVLGDKPATADADDKNVRHATTPADGKVMVLTATSGDTGKAALAGFAGTPGTGITVFYPEGKVSEIQRLQMTTQTGSNVNVCAVKGNFDDAQTAVKRIFGDRDLAAKLEKSNHVSLSSANSINVGRLVPQVVYYFSAYAQLVELGAIKVGDQVEFVVPTGNFGDILAGYYAKKLGLPVGRLTVASDRNNVLFDFLTTGTYNRKRPFYETTSPSMDILVSSNLERMLYYMSDGDTKLIRGLMDDLQNKGSFTISDSLLARIRGLFSCGWADENQVSLAITDCWNANHYVIDPHTACGYHVLSQMPREATMPRVLLSTASPYKFPRVVGKALGLDTTGTDFDCMDRLSEVTGTTAPANLRGLEHTTERFTDVISIEEMSNYVRNASQKL